MAFPTSPTNNETYTNILGTVYRYDSTATAWFIVSQLATGIQGLTGIYGLTGIQGVTGLALGATGIQGVTGIFGVTGIEGQTGIYGVTGFYGQTGIRGLTGIYGLTGLALGATGIQGLTGFYGLTGVQGATGIRGVTGLQGVTGLSGVGQTGIQGLTGLAGIREYQWFADQMDTPVNTNWTVNALAPLVADSSNASLVVRRFDDTLEEGAGFIAEIPSGITNSTFYFRSRAEAQPPAGVGKQVRLKLYNRDIRDNTTITAWSAGTLLTPLDFTNNVYFQYDSQTLSLATLGITAGFVTQFELTRVGGDGSDSLVGDWDLLAIKMGLS